jgi:hypothetical protein
MSQKRQLSFTYPNEFCNHLSSFNACWMSSLPSRWPRGTFYPNKLAITSPTRGGRSVGIVRSRTQTMEFFECLAHLIFFQFITLKMYALNTALKKAPWSESESELYRPSDRRLSAKWLPIFANRVCHVISVTDHYGRILGFLVRSRYFSIK